MINPLRYVRPDLVMRTSVLEPTTEGYQPVEAAQNVATQFTRIYGPTVRKWKQKKGSGVMGHLGQTAPCVCPTPKSGVMTAPPAPVGTGLYTRKGAMHVTGAVGADTNAEAIAAIARAFARGQSVRIRDQRGRIAVAHPGPAEKHTFFSSVINKAREAAARVFKQRAIARPGIQQVAARQPVVRQHVGVRPMPAQRIAPTVPARPGQIVPARRPMPAPPAQVIRAAPAPRFNRAAAAAGNLLKNNPSALPNRSLWLPEYQGARKELPRDANAAAVLAARLTRGPQAVTRPAVANAMNAFRNTGRYY